MQGLADVFALLRLPFESEGAAQLNRNIFETIYFGALEASTALAAELGAHSSYAGASVGLPMSCTRRARVVRIHGRAS